MKKKICIPVKVRREHIEDGIPACPNNCMVALAIQKCSTYTAEVWVEVDDKTDQGTVKLIGYKTLSGKLPEYVVKNIKKFDLEEKVEPFEFNLVLEQEEK